MGYIMGYIMGFIMNLYSFEMSDFDLLNRKYKKRLFNQINQRVNRRHYKHLRSMRSPIEPQIPVRCLKLNLVLGNPFHRFHEHHEFLVQTFTLCFLTLFFLVFVLISKTTLFEIKIFSLDPGFCVELDIVGFLLT
jgi:hypothetical protein